MNLFQRLKKAFNPVPEKPILPNNQTLFAPNNNIDQGYSAVFEGISYSCLRLRSEAISSLDYRFYTQTSQTEKQELSLDHWLVKLFNKPNPYFRKKEILRLISMWLDVNGNVFLYAPKNGLSYPAQLWILNPTYVTIMTGSDGSIQYYKYTHSNNTNNFLPDEIIHIRSLQPNNYNPFVGTGIVKAALETINADKELNKFTKRFMANDTLPPMVLETEQEMSPETWNLFQTQWNAKLPQHKLISVLFSGMKVTPLTSSGISSTSINIREVDEMLTKKLSTIYGIPYSKLTGENTSYASAKISDFSFRKDTIEPIAQDIVESFTMFFQKYEPNIIIDFNEFKFTDEEYEIKLRESNLKNGITTINEERAKLGLDLIEGGNTILIQNGLTTLENLMNPIQPFQPTQPETTKRHKKLLVTTKEFTEEKKLEYWNKVDKKITSISNKLNVSIAKVFKELEDIVLGNLYDTNKAYNIKELKSSQLFSKQQFVDLIDKYMSKDIKAAVIQSMKGISEDVNLSWSDIESQLDKTIMKTVNQTLTKVKTVEDTLHSDLQNIINKNKDLSVGELSDLLSEEFVSYNGKNAWKAKRISQTTSTYINNSSQSAVLEKFNISYVWLSSRDANTRDTHLEIDGQEPDQEGYFDVGGYPAKFPGDTGAAEEDINCRCLILPKIK